MTIPVETKNEALVGIPFTHASLHTDFPGSVGSNEVSGGAYARLAITMNAPAGGQRVQNVDVTFSVPARTIKWVGYWDASIFKFCAPNGGARPKNFMSLSSTDTVYSEGHGYSDTQTVVFFNGTPPGGLVEGTTYYVMDATADTFKVAATSGGTAIDLTSAPSNGVWMCAITEVEYVSPGTHRLSSSTIIVPD